MKLSRIRYAPFATAALLLMATSCGSSPDRALTSRMADLRGSYVFLARTTPAEVHMDALLTDRLVVDEAGCLRVAGGDRHTIIWPHGASLRETDSEVRVVDTAGNVIARVGERVRLGGGEVEDLPADVLSVPNTEAARSACPGRYWLVS